MDKDEFLKKLTSDTHKFAKRIATDDGQWIVKGFVDVYKTVYTISIDTKVVSKVLEILLIPMFQDFAVKNNLTLELPPGQNSYPDLTFVCNKTGKKFAVDFKSTKRKGAALDSIGAMTLGAFTGYFRNRDSEKFILYPYKDYDAHIVLGIIYTQVDNAGDEKKFYTIDELKQINSVIRDFEFFVQPKWKIASDHPGSGNTKNIGSVTNLDDLKSGNGTFSALGEEVFDDYWMYYQTKEMANGTPPYINLETYKEYKNKHSHILKK